MSPRFYIEWFESRSGFIEAESESAARQAWIDGVEVEHEDEFDAGILTFHEINEKGEKMIAWTPAHIQGAAEAMATAREFCGQPAEALEQYRQDENLPKTDLETREAIGMAFADVWEQWRQDAKRGVR